MILSKAKGYTNAKGYTLVEVLGVLVVLSIIALIAVPVVNNYLRSTKESAYQAQINNIVLGSKKWAAENLFLLPSEDGSVVTITLGQLKMMGAIDLSFKNPKNDLLFPNDLEIMIKKEGNQFIYTVLESSGTPITEESENLTTLTFVLIGSTTHYVEIGTSFVDPGYIAKRMDGVTITDVTKVITRDEQIVSSVLISALGEYEITYTASYQNESISMIRKVIVRDTTPPVISFPTTTTITVEQANINYNLLTGVVVTDNSGQTGIVPTTSGNVANIPGDYTITYTASDSSGNTATVTRTIKVVDNAIPTVVFGTNGNGTWAMSRNTSVTVSDNVGVALGSLRYLWTTTSSGIVEANFSTSFTNGGTITSPTGVTGDYYVWILAKDTSNNTSIVRSNVFKLDNTPPVIVRTGSNPINLSVGQSYTDAGATVTDTHSGVTGGVTATGTVNVNVPGTYTITYSKSDNAGNNAVAVTRTIVVADNIPPTVLFGTNGNGTWAKSRNTSVTISDTHSTVNTSSLRYLWTTTASGIVEANFSTSFTNGATLTSPAGVTGDYYLWILAKDTPGNTNIVRSNVFKLDNTLPTITTPGNSTITVQQVAGYNLMTGVSASDAHSGVNASGVGVSGSISTIPGNYSISYTATDYAENIRTVSRMITVQDIQSPVITLNGSNPMNVNVGNSYVEPGATAVDDVDGNFTNAQITKTGTVNVNVPGSYTIYYSVIDSSNNTGTATRTINVIDHVPPVIAFSMNGSTTWSKSHGTNVTVSDTHSSVNTSSLRYLWSTSTTTPSEASFALSFTNGGLLSSSSYTGYYYLWILAKDIHGNTAIQRTTNPFYFDNVLPTVTSVVSSISGITESGFVINRSGNASDSNSGISGYQYQTSPNGSTWTTRCTNTSTSCSVTGLSDNTLYYYRICAIDVATNQNCIASKTITTYSVAGSPSLAAGMIPITWNGSTWVKANTASGWHDYSNRQWANAALVSSGSRSTYQSAAVGTVVNENDIMAYLVWIPRYRYQLFNVAATATSYQTINVVFEGTGTAKSTGTTNGSWLTHPAFTFNGTELSGIWVGKFELTGNATTPTVKPNLPSYRETYLSSLYNAIQRFSIASTYGLSSTNYPRIIKNTEWGAVAYLSQSVYGKSSEIWINPNSNYTTGCAGTSVNNASTTSCNEYTTSNGQQASTTGNIYGIYDMSGGTWESVMGAGYQANGINISLSYSGFSQSFVDQASTVPYLDKYAYSTTFDDQAAFDKRLLGDATGETRGWRNDNIAMTTVDFPWFVRGATFSHGSYSGINAFSRSYGYGDHTTRLVIQTQ